MNAGQQKELGLWGCWTDVPVRHPWIPSITNLACGYDDRGLDSRCNGCYRQHSSDAVLALNEEIYR